MEAGILRGAGTAFGGGADWERLAVRRLAAISALAIGIGVIGAVIGIAFRQPNLGVRAGAERPMELAAVWGVLSLVTFLVARSERLTPITRLRVGLVYLVLSSVLAGLFRHWLPYAESDVVRGFSPIGLITLFFAVVIPVPPKEMALAASLAALADVGGLVFSGVVLGYTLPPWNLWVWLLSPDFFIVIIAVATSTVLHRLNEDVQRARDLGSYRLVERLGKGGMGEVWRADHQTLARPAAIKLIRPELIGAHDSEESQRIHVRFEREARSTAALTSPHTIAVYDFGRAEDGSFYYVMELLEGADLESIVAGHGAMPEDRAAHLLLQICHSLRDAHEHGVVHRDIKPANIFVCRQGTDRDFVKVLDFGLVKVESTDEASESDAAKLTDAGDVLGTPAYLAPEVALGKEATPRSDIYALGCVAFWLLTGRVVFDGRPQAVQQIVAHLQDEPERPSTLVSLHEELDALIVACLAKDPADRPASIEEVENVLRSLKLAERWTPPRASAWWDAFSTGDSDPSLAPTLEKALAPTES